jgi:hypothetical protein
VGVAKVLRISKLIVFLVTANPCPDEHFAIEMGESAIMVADPNRPLAIAVGPEPQ